METTILIKPFEPQLAPQFARLNKAWIQKYFILEPLDEQMLNDPEACIIEKGGQIFFAEYNGNIAGTFALQKVNNTTFELSKMAVDEAYQGLKIGNVLMQAAIEKAKEIGAHILVLYSNTILHPAIHLYKKFGFEEVPLVHSEYSRSNIKMQKTLTPNPSPEGEGDGVLQKRSSEFHRKASPVLFEFAKEQRRKGTGAEAFLWEQLRSRKLNGLKFRRQHPVGPYIADFYCNQKALVIELDGAIHQLPENKDYDKTRDQYLKDEGLKVLRFSKNDIYKNLQGVLQKIKEAANKWNSDNNQTS